MKTCVFVCIRVCVCLCMYVCKMSLCVQTNALNFIGMFPQVVSDIVLFSLCGSLGQLAILYNIREYGSLVNTIVTVTRYVCIFLNVRLHECVYVCVYVCII